MENSEERKESQDDSEENSRNESFAAGAELGGRSHGRTLLRQYRRGLRICADCRRLVCKGSCRRLEPWRWPWPRWSRLLERPWPWSRRLVAGLMPSSGYQSLVRKLLVSQPVNFRETGRPRIADRPVFLRRSRLVAAAFTRALPVFRPVAPLRARTGRPWERRSPASRRRNNCNKRLLEPCGSRICGRLRVR